MADAAINHLRALQLPNIFFAIQLELNMTPFF